IIIRPIHTASYDLLAVALLFSFQSYDHPPYVHSFPTRRSSDLRARARRRSSLPGPRRVPPAASLRHGAYGGGRRSPGPPPRAWRSEEHTSELQSSQISYAVFCLKKKKQCRHRIKIQSTAPNKEP